MNVIKIDASPRISIVRAKELILAALPTEKYAEVYFFVAANGEPDLEGEHQIKMADGKFATPYMERDLPEIFEKLNIIPCMINLPNMQGFRKGQEILYNISQQEFVRLAEAYGCNVEVSVAKSDDGLQKIDIAPDSSKSTVSPIQRAAAQNAATIETQQQRRARRYQLCIDAGLTMPQSDYKSMPRGIGAIAKKEGITRQAFVEDIKAHINTL